MNFKQWFQNESAKELARQYSQSLKPIPQDPKHHPEGDVLTHIKLVRRSIPDAEKYLVKLKTKEPWKTILQNIDPVTDDRQKQILKLAAWLHDIGKIPTTTITTDSGTRHWTEPGEIGKIRSLRHEDPRFYQPEIDKLFPLAPENIQDLYKNNKDLLDFLIERHMDVSKGGFPKHFIADHFENGKLIPSEKIKLLLILIYADKMGRNPQSQESIEKNDQALVAASEKNKINTQKNNKPKFDTPQDMIQSLKQKGISNNQIINAVKSKFPSEDIDVLLKGLS